MTAALTTSPAANPAPMPGPVLAAAPPRMTVEDYLLSEEASSVRREFVGHQVYAMAGARNVHQTLTTTFIVAIGIRLRGKPCQPFDGNTKVRVRLPNETRFYYPDAMVVCQPNAADEVFQDQPRLIAEVLSPSTRRTDEREKADAYRTIPSLTAYLLIEPDRPRVIVHRRTASGFVAEQYDGLEASVPLPDLETTLPLAELYERVDFTAAASANAAEASEA